MLFITFQLGTDRYAIEASQVVEVLPLVNPKQVPQAPPGVAGIFDYHGIPVPLIDLTELTLGMPSRKWMSTRILLINYTHKSGDTHLLGLLTERATETLRRREDEFTDSRMAIPEAPYLGSVLADENGIVQRIQVGKLLSDGICSILFPDLAESS